MSKEYTTTTATRDALNLALGAINMARNFAEQSALPVVRRLELMLVEITEIEKDVQHVERQVDAIDPRKTVPEVTFVTPGRVPPAIASMLTNLHPQERIALDAATRHGSLDPASQNDRLACESLFRKGVFRLNAQSRFEIEPLYTPWIKRAPTPHEILAALPNHQRELLRVLAARGGKIHVPPDGQYERDYYALRERGILVSDGALDKFRLADAYKDIAA